MSLTNIFFKLTDLKKENNMSHLDFENIEKKFQETLKLPTYKKFLEDFKSADEIFVVGNGGLWAVGNHASDDCNRLFAKAGLNKYVHSMDSQCLITSVANDYGYNNMFIKWLELHKKRLGKNKKIMVIGLSCSGTSKNVVSALFWAVQNGFLTAMICGQPSNVLPNGINEVCLHTKYFHTTEVLSLIIFYELIHSCGAQCPTIHDEIVRKGISQPLSRPLDE